MAFLMLRRVVGIKVGMTGGYVQDPHARVLHATGLLVLTLAGSKISAMTRFDNSVLPRFGLPCLPPD